MERAQKFVIEVESWRIEKNKGCHLRFIFRIKDATFFFPSPARPYLHFLLKIRNETYTLEFYSYSIFLLLFHNLK